MSLMPRLFLYLVQTLSCKFTSIRQKTDGKEAKKFSATTNETIIRAFINLYKNFNSFSQLFFDVMLKSGLDLLLKLTFDLEYFCLTISIVLKSFLQHRLYKH